MPPEIVSYVVKHAKLTDYLLNLDHPAGWSKAKFFLGLGFTAERLQDFMGALVAQADNHTSVDQEDSPYGTLLAFTGPLTSPSGTSIDIVTVWLVRPDSRDLNFVTAYPT